MAKGKVEARVRLDLNGPRFQAALFALERPERAEYYVHQSTALATPLQRV